MSNSYSVTDFLEKTTYKDKEVINVFKKIEIPENTAYDEYIIREGDRWDLLSLKFYGTSYLWWLIASFNKILDPFITQTTLVPGEKIKIIKSELVQNLLLKMKDIV